MKKLLWLVVVTLLVDTSHAHHGSNSQFDQSKKLEIAGVVTKLRFVNPHSYVYFEVTNEDGGVDDWRCEMRAATVLKRSGWSEDMFTPGTRIRIEGVPARREPHGCYVEKLQLDDGEVVERYQQLEGAEKAVAVAARPATLANGRPNISGDWSAPQRLRGGTQVRDRATRGFDPPGYARSAAGTAASADFDLERDNPRFHCMPINILADWTFDQHINRIEQNDDTVKLAYGFMDIVRTIHLNMSEHPDDLNPSRAGHSTGRWEGNTLVVDTIGFAPGYLDGRSGIKHSNQLHVIERFTLDPQKGAISRDYSVEDPLYLDEVYSRQDTVLLSGTPFDPYNCDDLTTEIVEGH